MSSYQVPQFLDSGDKILGPLNLRQFFYVLVTFLICVVIFTITASILPIGGYAVIPAIPVLLFGLYLAMGKYNGRDSEIYILKLLKSSFKPKKMIYVRQPFLDDLNKRAFEWSAPQIEARWAKSIAEITEDEKDTYSNFKKDEAEKKAMMIRELGGYIDIGLYNSLSEIKKRELEIDFKQGLLKQTEYLRGKNKNRARVAYSNNFYGPQNYQILLDLNQINQENINQENINEQNKSKIFKQNFLQARNQQNPQNPFYTIKQVNK